MHFGVFSGRQREVGDIRTGDCHGSGKLIATPTSSARGRVTVLQFPGQQPGEKLLQMCLY